MTNFKTRPLDRYLSLPPAAAAVAASIVDGGVGAAGFGGGLTVPTSCSRFYLARLPCCKIYELPKAKAPLLDATGGFLLLRNTCLLPAS